MADCPDARLASAPKGTLPLRSATTRTTKYNPDTFEGNDTRRCSWDIHKADTSAQKDFFAEANRQAIVRQVCAELGGKVKAESIPRFMVDESMKRSYEMFGESAVNAPGATFGPSESQQQLAPAQKYNTLRSFGTPLGDLNAFAVRRMKEQIIGERLQFSRYQQDLSGALHVMAYPQLPPESMSTRKQLIYRDWDDISSTPRQ